MLDELEKIKKEMISKENSNQKTSKLNNINNKNKTKAKKTNTKYKGLKVELTPKKYLNLYQEIEQREQLFAGKIKKPKLTLKHEKENSYDEFAIKVFCDSIFIGYVLKQNNKYNINNFCFKNEKIKKVYAIFYNHNIELIIKNEEHNDHNVKTNSQKSIIIENPVSNTIGIKNIKPENTNISDIDLNEIPTKFLSNVVLVDLIDKASTKEKSSLTKAVYGYESKLISSQAIQQEICSLGGDSFANYYRGEGNAYLDIVLDIAEKLELTSLPSYSCDIEYFDDKESLKYNKEEAIQKGITLVNLLEKKIILKIIENHYETLDIKEKDKFDKQLKTVVHKFDSNSDKYLAGAAGLMVLGNLGGFATYTFLTTAMSTLSFGALGFGAYTTATAILGSLLGPVGWSALGIGVIWNFSSPNTKKLLPIVLEIAAIRNRIYQEKKTLEFQNTLRAIELPTFEKIRRYCVNLSGDEIPDNLTIEIRKNSKMYKALIYDAFDQFLHKLIGKNIDILDWGCGQGIASSLALDYIREKQYEINVKEVTLIEKDIIKTNRAKIYIDLLSSNKSRVKTINKNIEDLIEDDFKVSENTKINLFINCDALKNMNPDKLPLVGGYYVFIFNDKCNENHNFFEYYNDIFKLEKISSRTNKIGKYQRDENIFKIDLGE